MAMRLWLELDWAGKTSTMLDDEQLKYVDSGEKTGKIIELMGAEYNLVITPFFKNLPRRPDLIVWCRAPLSECAARDMAKAHGGETIEQITNGFTRCWGSYFIDADLILNTYDGTRKTKETTEMCWKILKEKVESIFGDFGWHDYTDGEPAWDGAEPRFQPSSWNRKRIGGWFWRWNRNATDSGKGYQG